MAERGCPGLSEVFLDMTGNIFYDNDTINSFSEWLYPDTYTVEGLLQTEWGRTICTT